MNNDRPYTLREFFSIKERELLQERHGKLESLEGLGHMKEQLASDAKEIRWPMACREILKRVNDLLDIRVVNILTGAWNKYRELIKYADRSKESPDETFLVHLIDHTIKSLHNPYVLILVNNKEVGKVHFEIAVSLALEGIILKIRDGKIKEISAGSCKGKGTIKCENFLLVEKETETLTLSDSLCFGEGISI